MFAITSKRQTATLAETSDLPEVDFSGFETQAVHAGYRPDPLTGARDVPIYQSTSFCFNDCDHAARLFKIEEAGMIYTRLTNPTVAALEARITALEGGVDSTCTSCGHAAQLMALYALMTSGDTMVCSKHLYGGTITQMSRTILKFGWKAEFVDTADMDQVKAALAKPGVKGLFIESLCNPGATITDMRALADAAHAVGVPLLVDNTLASPYLCRPIEHGADIVLHSTTKFISGHGSAMGGCIVDSGNFDWKQNDKFPSLSQPEPGYNNTVFAEYGPTAMTVFQHAVGLRDLGSCMAPMVAWLTLTGVETLALRMDKHCQNALEVALWLEKHPKVKFVSYPALPSSPYKALCDRYMGGKGGAVLTFGVSGGFEEAKKVVDGCQLFSLLANLGDVRSLIIHPASTTHSQLSSEKRREAGAGDDTIRLCVGIETATDLIKDLETALEMA